MNNKTEKSEKDYNFTTFNRYIQNRECELNAQKEKQQFYVHKLNAEIHKSVRRS